MDWLSLARASAQSGGSLLVSGRSALRPSFISQRLNVQRQGIRRCQQRSHTKAAAQQQAPAQEEKSQTASKGACYGCGLDLQTLQPGAAGYVTPDKYAIRLQHRHLNKLLCERCQELSNGRMVPAVEDFSSRNLSGAQLAGKALISPDQLRAQLKGLAEQRILAVLVVDLLDCSGSFLTRVRDLVGRNPVLLIGTKVDLLPKGTDTAAVTEWLLATAGHRRLNVVSAHLVGSPAGQGVPEVASAILRDRKGRSVYVLGAANVGKSSFIRALVREMSKGSSRCFQPTAKAQSRRLPVESAMPGTTLQTIKLQAFSSGGALFDTPGVHLHHRLPHLLSPEELRELHPRKRLRPYYPPLPQDLTPHAEEAESTGASAQDTDMAGSVSATYQWGGVARVDVVSAPFGTALAFYGPPALHVHALPLVSQHDVVQSAAALATQHDTRQHSTAQRDEGQHGKAQHAAEPAQEAAVAADDDSNDHSLSPDQPSMSDLKLDVHEALPNSHQTPIASHSLDGRQRTSSAHVPQLQQQHRHVQPPAADSSHDFTTPARAADSVSESAEEGMEEDEGLFAEASVISRGGLKMVEKVISVSRLSGALADIAISGLPGWVAVLSPGVQGDIHMRVWAPVGVEVFLRPPIPVLPGQADQNKADVFW